MPNAISKPNSQANVYCNNSMLWSCQRTSVHWNFRAVAIHCTTKTAQSIAWESPDWRARLQISQDAASGKRVSALDCPSTNLFIILFFYCFYYCFLVCFCLLLFFVGILLSSGLTSKWRPCWLDFDEAILSKTKIIKTTNKK